jgi:hypothetical protein
VISSSVALGHRYKIVFANGFCSLWRIIVHLPGCIIAEEEDFGTPFPYSARMAAALGADAALAATTPRFQSLPLWGPAKIPQVSFLVLLHRLIAAGHQSEDLQHREPITCSLCPAVSHWMCPMSLCNS